jgi:hypothetical protein
MMNTFRRLSSLALNIQKRPVVFFSNWKERDEAAEKVFITQAESTMTSI